MQDMPDRETQLNDFDPEVRRRTLTALAAQGGEPVQEGTNVNMHMHSFFSYNANGYSPSRLAWEAHRAGLYAAGLCDFDVLDGLEEFLEAGRLLGLRTAVNLETRAYLAPYADVDISSPGEPGVTYVMGAGFARPPRPGSEAAQGLQGYRERARQRNVALIGRINPHVPEIAVDYEEDVLPLTPAGAATERHIVTAYLNKSRERFQDLQALVDVWSRILDRDREETATLLADPPRMEEIVRARLAKRGGLGYQAPSVDTFPPVESFMQWVASCEAIPMITWLDGTSPGEQDGAALLDCMIAMGGAALNIIPDRNWNVSDGQERETKQAHLRAIMEEAGRRYLPVNIGTEMNKLGLPFVDDLAGAALRPYKQSFLQGARIMAGHTQLLRYAGFSYVGARAAAAFNSTPARNAFFEAVGALRPPTPEQAAYLEEQGPDKALAWFHDEIRKGNR